jgi:TonB family protein
VQGVVLIEAVIGPTGHVDDARVLRSIPLLDQAALDAVRQWEFTPSVLNGTPVPVIMTVTVQFTLADDRGPLSAADREALLQELNANKEKWRASRPQSYMLRIGRPGPPVDASVVRGDAIQRGTMSVDLLFDSLEQSIRTADRVVVRYNPTFGNPAALNIDPSLSVMGDEMQINVAVLPSAAGRGRGN